MMTDNFRPSATVGGKGHKTRSRGAFSAAWSFSVMALVFAASQFFCPVAGASHLDGGENIAEAAENLIGDIRETHYQHKTYVVPAEGIYDMDCSGFIDYLLKRVAPQQYANLPIETGHARPRAAMYFDLFQSLPGNPAPGWKSIDRLADTQRGDIIAWSLEASTQKPGDTGHVVIVANPPVPTNEREYRVAVYDSSGIHHDDDSRLKTTNGIGKGVITFKVDERGIPVGFRFNSLAHFHLEPIAIGRLVH
jgi:hypothetical protein